MTVGFVVILTNCKSPDNFVSITPSISVWLPNNYKISNVNTHSHDTTFEATLNHDRLNVFKLYIKGADTLSLDKKKDELQKNVDKFIKTFDVKNVIVSDKMIGNIIQKDFSFGFTRHDSAFIFYGRFLCVNENFLAFCYQTINPADQNSIKTKDKFFDFYLTK